MQSPTHPAHHPLTTYRQDECMYSRVSTCTPACSGSVASPLSLRMPRLARTWGVDGGVCL